MEKAVSDAEKSALGKQWLDYRSPALEETIVKNGWHKLASWTDPKYKLPPLFLILLFKRGEYAEITAILAQNSFEYYVPMLARALFDSDRFVREAASVYYRQLDTERRLKFNQEVTNRFSWSKPNFYMQNLMLTWLAEQKYYPKDQRDQYVRVLVSVLNDEFAAYNPETASVIQLLIDFAERHKYPDQLLPQKVSGVLRNLQTQQGRDYLCRYVLSLLKIGKPCASFSNLAVQSGYEPSAAPDKALFFFLTRQFEKYDAFDFDRTILRTVHATADNKLRQIITGIVRESGRQDYLDIIAPHQVSGEQDIATQQTTIIKVLRAGQQWEQIWQKVFELNFWGSVQALGTLQRKGWQPPTDYERTLMGELGSIMRLGLPKTRSQIEPIALFEQPLHLLTAPQKDALKALHETNLAPETRNALSYIETVLTHRFRHDIEVDFAPQVQPNKFDVELESDL
jgi:hypothetical protein